MTSPRKATLELRFLSVRSRHPQGQLAGRRRRRPLREALEIAARWERLDPAYRAIVIPDPIR